MAKIRFTSKKSNFSKYTFIVPMIYIYTDTLLCISRELVVLRQLEAGMEIWCPCLPLVAVYLLYFSRCHRDRELSSTSPLRSPWLLRASEPQRISSTLFQGRPIIHEGEGCILGQNRLRISLSPLSWTSLDHLECPEPTL